MFTECLRLGSRQPGCYWGTCAIDVFQNFSIEPDEPVGYQLSYGDTGATIPHKYLGKTNLEAFKTRLAIGSFDTRVLPNHIFLASMNSQQVESEVGKKWLAILKDHGFEFLGSTPNSVYGDSKELVYLFGMFRCTNGVESSPPRVWHDLPGRSPEAAYKELTPKFYSREELDAEGIPVYSHGRWATQPELLKNLEAKAEAKAKSAKSADFPIKVSPVVSA